MAASLYSYRRGLFVGVHPGAKLWCRRMTRSSPTLLMYLSIEVDGAFFCFEDKRQCNDFSETETKDLL
jgi:hypothetical protein